MTDVVEVSRCASGRACRAAETVDGRRTAAVVADGRQLCESCTGEARRAFARLPHDWLKLKASLADTGGGAGEKVRSTPTPAAPINVAAEALMARIVDCVKRGDATVREVMGMDVMAGSGRGSRAEYRFLTAATMRIVPNVDRLIGAPEGAYWRGHVGLAWSGVDVALMALDVRRRVRQHLGETRQREVLHLPCPRCNARALVREVEDRRRWTSATDGVATPEVIRCAACEGEWTEAEYRWLSRMVLSERERKEIRVLEWLLAEATWQRDVALWLATEREWAMDNVAQVIGLEGAADLLVSVRRSDVAA